MCASYTNVPADNTVGSDTLQQWTPCLFDSVNEAKNSSVSCSFPSGPVNLPTPAVLNPPNLTIVPLVPPAGIPAPWPKLVVLVHEDNAFIAA